MTQVRRRQLSGTLEANAPRYFLQSKKEEGMTCHKIPVALTVTDPAAFGAPPALSGWRGKEITNSGPWGEAQPRSTQGRPARGTQPRHNQATRKPSPPPELEGRPGEDPSSAAAPEAGPPPHAQATAICCLLPPKTRRREGGEGRHVACAAGGRVASRHVTRGGAPPSRSRPSPAGSCAAGDGERERESARAGARARAPPSLLLLLPPPPSFSGT